MSGEAKRSRGKPLGSINPKALSRRGKVRRLLLEDEVWEEIVRRAEMQGRSASDFLRELVRKALWPLL